MPGLPVPVAADTCALRCASRREPVVSRRLDVVPSEAYAAQWRTRSHRCATSYSPAVSMARLLEQIDDVPPPGYLPKSSRLARIARPGWGNIGAAGRRAFQQPPAISSELALTPGATPPAQVPRRALSFRVSAHHGPRSRARGRCQRAWRSACRAPRSPGPRQVRPRHSRAARSRARKQSRCASHATADGP